MNREEYLETVSKRYPKEMRLLTKGGKLIGDWTNVVQHCLVQAAAAEILTGWLDLSDSAPFICSVAACHDWKKRRDLKPRDFSWWEAIYGNFLMRKLNLDETLMFATTPSFLIQHANAKTSGVSYLQRIQFYLDSITMEAQIVPFLERIQEAETRHPELNQDEKITALLDGRRYWEVEREVAFNVQKEIFHNISVREDTLELRAHEQIPQFINDELNRRAAAG